VRSRTSKKKRVGKEVHFVDKGQYNLNRIFMKELLRNGETLHKKWDFETR
jgi:hypothetical protein